MKNHIVFVLDKSGSMNIRRQATIDGFNGYLHDIQGDDNLEKAKFTLVTFDTDFETVYANAPLSNVSDLSHETYQPSGATALYDAVAHALSITKDEVKNKHRALVVILTDGEENSSKEYSRDKIFDLVKEYQDKGNYTFVFLGCDMDVWGASGAIGVVRSNTADFDPNNIQEAYAKLSRGTALYAMAASMSVEDFFEE